MNEHLSGNNPEMSYYDKMTVGELMVLSHTMYQEIAHSLGPVSSPSYNPAVGKFLDEAQEKIVSEPLKTGVGSADDLNQREKYIQAISILEKAKEMVN